jgi:hypothetical protein
MLEAPARHAVTGLARLHEGGVLYEFRVLELGVPSEAVPGGVRILSSPRLNCPAYADVVPGFVQYALRLIGDETPGERFDCSGSPAVTAGSAVTRP